MTYQLLKINQWRMRVNKASDGSLINTIYPDNSMQTQEGMTIEIEAGINNCKEASFTASGALDLPPLSAITFQVSADQITWFNLFKGELVMQPNKWDTEPGYYNVVGYRKHFYEIPLPDNRYAATEDIGKLIRHVMYDISGIGGSEFPELNLALPDPGAPPPPPLPPLPPKAGHLLGPHINVVASKIPNISRTAPEVVTNTELVGSLFEKIETFFEDNLTPTKFGVDPEGDFRFGPLNNDVFDLDNHPDLVYKIEWPSMQNERTISCIKWYLGKYSDGSLIHWDYKDTNLINQFGYRYKRLLLKNSEPFKVINAVYELVDIVSGVATPLASAPNLERIKTHKDVINYSAITRDRFGLDIITEGVAAATEGGFSGVITTTGLESGSIKFLSNVDTNLFFNNNQLNATILANVPYYIYNAPKGLYTFVAAAVDPAYGSRQNLLGLENNGMAYAEMTFATGGVEPIVNIGGNVSQDVGTGEQIRMTIPEDYLRINIAITYNGPGISIARYNSSDEIIDIIVLGPSGTTRNIYTSTLKEGKAGDKLIIVNKLPGTESESSPRSAIYIAELYAEKANEALLNAYSKIHLVPIESEPAEITIFNNILLNPPGKIKIKRPDGSSYIRRIDSVVYPLNANEFGNTVIKIGSADDPFKVAQAISIELRDEKAAIEVFSGNETFKSGGS